MKAIVSLLALILGCLSLSAATVTQYFDMGNPIKYLGTDYYLAWSSHPTQNYYIQEYLPKGESLGRYNQMFTVNVLFCNITPQDAVQAKIAELKQRKKSDPITNYKITTKGNDYILEFLVGDSENGKTKTVEVDVHYYRQMTINGRKALVLLFYSGRAYGDDIIPFIKSIPSKRAKWYAAIEKLNTLSPKFPNK